MRRTSKPLARDLLVHHVDEPLVAYRIVI